MVVAGVLEVEQVVKAAYARLAADATLNTTLALGGRVYRDLAPEGVVFPVVTLAPMSAVDLNTLGGAHVWQDVQLLVKVTERFTGVVPNYSAKLIPLAQRMHLLLDGYTTTVDGVLVVQFRRVSAPPQPPEVQGGVRYVHLNQLFQTEAYPA